jgi:transcriptional regulator with XRE-family HTH domain
MSVPVPNASRAKGEPAYLRGLVDRSGLSQAEVARALGIDARTFRRYLLGEVRIPYLVEFGVECAARAAIAEARDPLGEFSTAYLSQRLRKLRATFSKAAPASYARQRTEELVDRIERELERRFRPLPSLPSKS